MASKKNGKEKDEDAEKIIKKVVSAYKYSAKGSSNLYEAIILDGEPCFVTWDNYANTIKIKDSIEETTMIIRPPSAEEYPYTPYEFADQDELNEFFGKANTTTLDELYQTVNGFYQKYVDQDRNIIVILSADSILTYFQDLFPIIHYCEGIGGNDAGKSTIGYTFECTGYRVIRGTSISGANYYRVLSNIEPGQCTIIEDEADNISEDPDKVKILKAGYEYKAKIPKTNMNTRAQEQNWYYPYCYKMLLAEKSLSEWKAKGLVDRTFSFKCRPGRVRYSIKNVATETINKSPLLERLYNELLDFRKLMLCYRLIHYTDDLPQIKISVINRDEELSYPLLQLFYGTEAFEEIKTALEFFLKQRRERRSRSIYAALYPILKKLVYTDNKTPKPKLISIPYSLVWQDITSGGIKGSFNKYSSTEYDTEEYGTLYLSTLSKQISDNFAADLNHKEEGSIITFYTEKFDSYDEVYNHNVEGSENEVTIKVELVKTEGADGTEGSSDAFHNFDDTIKEEDNASPKPSDPSDPSAFPPKCYHCDYSTYENKEEYQYHCVLRHAGKPAYPGPADIKEGLIAQGMSWENTATR
jgi:hypothetical protein